MRLMIIGRLNGHISLAGKIALKRGAKVTHCEDIDQAMGALLNGKSADLAMVDVKQKIGEFVKRLKDERIHMPIIACGIETDARAAVKAIELGAKEYLPLPPDPELIAAVIEAVTQEDSSMIADDPSMKPIISLADKIAPSEATILITGESGTGKEVMSRYIHNKSKRKDNPFIAINCAAIPENLLESELFGHEKGAFTGANGRRIGKFEEAHTGTILLDEVSEMHPLLQAKFLRAIQEKEITRVGGSGNIKVDVRILATSNRNLEESVRKGDFREDLYFRLNVVNIPLPPLRDRPSDIARLAQMFADKYAKANGVARKNISKAAITKLQNCTWRGNIRELENTMHRAILMSCEDEIEDGAIFIQSDGLSEEITPATKTDTPADQNMIGRTIADVERDMIINTLDHCLGNRTHAANILGISIRTLRNKLNQYKDEAA